MYNFRGIPDSFSHFDLRKWIKLSPRKWIVPFGAIHQEILVVVAVKMDWMKRRVPPPSLMNPPSTVWSILVKPTGAEWEGVEYLIIILLSCWQARIFWAAATSVAFMCGVYLIYQASMLARLLIFIPVFLLQVFAKSVASPVLVSLASEPTPIWEIPFPALTVCNMNKVRI